MCSCVDFSADDIECCPDAPVSEFARALKTHDPYSQRGVDSNNSAGAMVNSDNGSRNEKIIPEAALRPIHACSGSA